MSVRLGLNGADWNILYSKNCPSHPDSDLGGWRMVLKDTREPHYIQRKGVPSTFISAMKSGTRLEIDMRCDTDPDGATFTARNGGTPRCTIMLRKKNDDALTAANGRFWCGGSRFTLAEGSATLVCNLDRSAWTNVDGQSVGSSNWTSMLNNLGTVGVTFGGTFFGHGVKMQNSSHKGKVWVTRFEVF